VTVASAIGYTIGVKWTDIHVHGVQLGNAQGIEQYRMSEELAASVQCAS